MLHQLPEPVVHHLLTRHLGYWKCIDVSLSCQTLRTYSHEPLQMLRAARTIRRFWRNCVCKGLLTSRIFADYTSLNLNAIGDMDIRTFVEFTRNRTTMAVAFSYYQRLYSMARRTERIHVRPILNGYRCHLFPADVFSNLNPLELPVKDSSAEMIRCLHAAATAKTDMRQHATRSVQAIHTFFSHYMAWKNPDPNRLLDRAVLALRALYQAGNELDSPPQDPMWIEFRTQIRNLRENLARMSEARLAQVDAHVAETYGW